MADEKVDILPIQPFMYSYYSSDLFGSKTSFKVEKSKWSRAHSLENAGTNGELSIGCEDSNKVFS